MREQLAETQHHAVDEGQYQIDGGAADQGPDGWGLVEDDGGGGRRGRHGEVFGGGVLLAVGVHSDAGFCQRVRGLLGHRGGWGRGQRATGSG